MSVFVCLSVCLFAIAYINKSSAVAEIGNRLATIDMDRKVCVGAAVPLSVGEGGKAGSPSNTVSPRPRSIQVPIVWPQYTNVTDRQTGHRSVAYGEPLLVTVAQKLHVQTSRDFLVASSDDNAVSYVLPVLFMMSCCPIISLQTKVTPI